IWFSALVGGAFWLGGDARIGSNEYMKGIIRVCCGIVAAVVLGWAVLGFLPQRRADRFGTRLSHVPKVGHTLAEVWVTVWTYRQRPLVIYGLIAMTAVCHVGMVVMYHLAVRV